MTHLIEAVLERTDITREEATKLVEAARPLWEALDREGLADAFGGAECERVLPVAIDTILREANPLRYGLDPATGEPL